MTREDTKRILDRICRLYMSQAKKYTAADRKIMLDTWQDTFKHDSYDDVDNAVSRYVGRGSAFMPLATDIVKELTAMDKTQGGKPYTETDVLFAKLVKYSDMLANDKERTSILDPGGPRWSDEYQKKIYMHPETIVSTKSFTQYDFKQLPAEIQVYVEDIEGLKAIWPEIESSREMARRRFEMQLPAIKEELARREDRNIKENRERLEELWRRML